jgi:hypothetical protein
LHSDFFYSSIVAVTYPPTGKIKVALIVIGCALCFFGAAFREYLVAVGLVILVAAHPQILESREDKDAQ